MLKVVLLIILEAEAKLCVCIYNCTEAENRLGVFVPSSAQCKRTCCTGRPCTEAANGGKWLVICGRSAVTIHFSGASLGK